MNYKGFLFVFLGLLVACSLPKGTARLSGDFENLGNEAVYLYTEDGVFEGVDTLRMESGKFKKDFSLGGEPVLVTMLFPNFSRRYIILTPGEEVTISGDANSLMQAEVVGTEENEALTAFRKNYLEKPESEQRLAAVKFIEDHPSSLASLALFRTYFVDMPTMDAPTARRLLKLMEKDLKHIPAYRTTAQLMQHQLRTAVGEPLPAFSATTLDGRTISHTNFRGKPLLVMCVGMWNPDSRAYLARLRNIQRTVPKVQCLLVSFDLDRSHIADLLRRDSISVPTLFDGRSLHSPLYETFGVRMVPEVFLVNSQGRITARDLREDQLQTAVEGLK